MLNHEEIKKLAITDKQKDILLVMADYDHGHIDESQLETNLTNIITSTKYKKIVKNYEIDQKVWIKPSDVYADIEGKVIGFQKVGDHLPIVQFEYRGEMHKNAFDLNRINPYEAGPVKPYYFQQY